MTRRKVNEENKNKKKRGEVIEWDKMLPFIVFLWEHWDQLELPH